MQRPATKPQTHQSSAADAVKAVQEAMFLQRAGDTKDRLVFAGVAVIRLSLALLNNKPLSISN